MERVIKRLLLHNNRENDEIKESDFDELKQDVQMIRYDVMNGLKNTKEDAVKYVKMFHTGISLLGDFLFETKDDTHLLDDFTSYKMHEKKLEEELEFIKNPSKVILAIQNEANKEKNEENNSQAGYTEATETAYGSYSSSKQTDETGEMNNEIDESNNEIKETNLDDQIVMEDEPAMEDISHIDNNEAVIINVENENDEN
jgi:hypothetical protein